MQKQKWFSHVCPLILELGDSVEIYGLKFKIEQKFQINFLLQKLIKSLQNFISKTVKIFLKFI